MKVRIATNQRLDASQRIGPGFTTPEFKSIDWANASDRKWLVNHMHWAMNNNRTVMLIPNPGQFTSRPAAPESN